MHILAVYAEGQFANEDCAKYWTSGILSGHEPFLQRPHRTTIRNLIYRICESLRDKLRLLLTPLKHISITIDGWKARSNISFLMMTGHWISPSWQPMSCTLAVQPLSKRHTAKHLADEVHLYISCTTWHNWLIQLLFRLNVFWRMWDSLEHSCQRQTTMLRTLFWPWTPFQERWFGATPICWILQFRMLSRRPSHLG